MLYLVHLDAVHLDDLLFTQSLGRLMMGTSHRLILVHGDGGQSERLLESAGIFPDPNAEPSDQERALVDQAVRQTARKIVGLLTDAQVPAVGIHGGDRGLLRVDGGDVQAGSVGWLGDLANQRAIPVVSTLMGGPIGVASDADVLAALATGLRAAGHPVEAVVFQRVDGRVLLPDSEGRPQPKAEASHVSEITAELPDPDAVRALLNVQTAVRVTTPPAFLGPSGPGGTLFYV
jgi:isopentenyl phosphate kinase